MSLVDLNLANNVLATVAISLHTISYQQLAIRFFPFKRITKQCSMQKETSRKILKVAYNKLYADDDKVVNFLIVFRIERIFSGAHFFAIQWAKKKCAWSVLSVMSRRVNVVGVS